MADKRFDLIVFDWDGTLYDSTAAITRAIQAAVADVGGTVPSDAQASHVIGLGLTQALAYAAPDVPPARYADLSQHYRRHWAQEVQRLHLFDGIEALLATLRAQGYRLAVATGKTRAGLNEAMQHTALHGVFHDTRTADETAGKPDPQMLHELMWALDATPERTLMIGDTSHDLTMAERAGSAAVGVSYGAHDLPALQACAPLHIAHDVTGLGDWLAQHA